LKEKFSNHQDTIKKEKELEEREKLRKSIEKKELIRTVIIN